MNDANKKRFIRALSEAVDELTANAKCYGYKNEPEFVEIVSQMRACRESVRASLQANEDALLQEQKEQKQERSVLMGVLEEELERLERHQVFYSRDLQELPNDEAHAPRRKQLEASLQRCAEDIERLRRVLA